eukprot:8461169-Ditylum_brightwellii.AAC.1
MSALPLALILLMVLFQQQRAPPNQMHQPHPIKTPLHDPLREPVGLPCAACYFLGTDGEMSSSYPPGHIKSEQEHAL